MLSPFMIGLAIDDYLNNSYSGLVLFGLLGLVTLALMTTRRFYDTRLYATIYEEIGIESTKQSTKLSTKSARVNMLREIIDFFEYSMPELINNIAVLFGSLIFLAILNTKVFVASLIVSVLIVAIYGFTSKKTLSLNREFNDEYEKQVDIIGTNKPVKTRKHIKLLNKSTIRLSDIETFNFGISWILIICLQLFAVVVTSDSNVAYGVILSIILYIFEFADTSVGIPYSWQEYLRLRDILSRIKKSA